MKIDDFDYELPEELIAQVPLENREESRLLILNKDNGKITEEKFYNVLNYLNENHILVLNEGEVNGYGTHEELLKNNEIYRDIYELQKKGAEE